MKRIFSIAALLIFMFSMTATSQENVSKEKETNKAKTTQVGKNFVDSNGDGVCDECGSKKGECKGNCDGTGKGHKHGDKKNCDGKGHKNAEKKCGSKQHKCCGPKNG